MKVGIHSVYIVYIHAFLLYREALLGGWGRGVLACPKLLDAGDHATQNKSNCSEYVPLSDLL